MNSPQIEFTGNSKEVHIDDEYDPFGKTGNASNIERAMLFARKEDWQEISNLFARAAKTGNPDDKIKCHDYMSGFITGWWADHKERIEGGKHFVFGETYTHPRPGRRSEENQNETFEEALEDGYCR